MGVNGKEMPFFRVPTFVPLGVQPTDLDIEETRPTTPLALNGKSESWAAFGDLRPFTFCTCDRRSNLPFTVVIDIGGALQTRRLPDGVDQRDQRGCERVTFF